MENLRTYRLRGSPDLPIDVYTTSIGQRRRTFSHWHPELEITFVEKGTTIYRMFDQTLTLHPGDILIVPPNTVHGQNAYTSQFATWSMVINPDAIAMPKTHIFQKKFVEPLQQGRLQMPTLLHPGEPAHDVLFPLLQRFKNCLIYTENYKINRFSTAMAICTALLPYCRITDAPLPAPPQYDQAIQGCMRYIRDNYSQRLTLEALAAQADLHPNYLCTLFKAHTGQTVVEYITRIRVDAAAQLLRATDLPVSKVAEHCGFRSECLLYKYFKATFGTTPIAYRKQK